MDNISVKSTYERIILYRRIPYWIYWPLVGLIGYVLGEVIIWLANDNRFFYTQIIFAAGIAFLPLAIISFLHKFEEVLRDLSPLLWDKQEVFESWLRVRLERIFTLSSWVAKLVVGFIVLAAIITVAILGFPFQSILGNVLAIIGFTPLLIICGQGAYLLLDLLITLREITFRSPKVDFFMLPHPAITKLQNYYSSITLIVTIAYVCLAIAIWQGPYGFSLEMQIWLTVLAFYPISMFFWSFFHVHELIKNIKNSYIEAINKEVKNAWKCVSDGGDVEEVEKLVKVMEIQEKLQKIKVWPIAVQGTLTFLATLITVTVQIVISILELLKL